MLQRIQTVYFLLAVILTALPFAGISLFEAVIHGKTLNVHTFDTESHYFYLSQLIEIALLIWTIFSFKNRKRQLILSWIAVAYNVIAVVYSWFKLSQLEGIEGTISIQVGTYLFVAAIIFILLGMNGIKKDNKLIDSLNRLR